MFPEFVLLVFLCFYEVWCVPRGVTFGAFVAKNCFFVKKAGPLFLYTITASWLDFQGIGLPERFKKRENEASTNDHFFQVHKTYFVY